MARCISSSESSCITTLRCVAMLMIVACHIVLSYSCKYYAVLNIGVQFFFILSAFLFAQKEIDNPFKWMKKRILKLYPQLFLFLIVAFTLLFLVRPDLFNIKKVIFYFLNCQYFLGADQYDELDHLWFMTTIFVCYLVTPVLQRISKIRTWPIVICVLLMLLNYYVTNGKLDWLFLYSFVYLLFKQTKNVSYWIVLLMGLGLIWVAFQINWIHILNVDWQRLMLFDLTAMLVVIIALWLFQRKSWSKVPRYIEWISACSFEIYIVHNF